MSIQASTSRNISRKHSLVLVKDKINLLSLLDLLSSIEVNCYTSCSLNEAVAICRNNPQITSAYVQPPNASISLFEIVHELRQANPRLRFVAIANDAYSLEENLANGFERVISPPFKKGDIFDCQPI